MKGLKIFYISCVVVLLASSGCDKQDNWNDVAKSGAKDGVGFGSTFADAFPIYALPDAGTIADSIGVFYTGSNSGDKSITVTVDTSVVSEYNMENETAIPPAPTEFFTIPSTVTIPGGSNKGVVAGTFDITGMASQGINFAIGLRLSYAGGYVLTGQEKQVIIITIQNIYDGDYTTKGYLVHPSSPRALADTKHLSTIDAATSEAGLADLYGSDYYFDFTVDASNKLTNWVPIGATPALPQSGFMNVDNPTADPNYPGGNYTSANYNNTYDPATGNFAMHYGYGVGSTGQSGYSREVYEKWTR